MGFIRFKQKGKQVEFIYEYGLFLLKAVTLVFAILMLVGGLISVASKQKKDSHDGHIEVEKLNDELDEHKEIMQDALLDREEQKQKDKKAEEKANKKRIKDGLEEKGNKKRVFVLDFDGDVEASEVENLSREITAILTSANKEDEVVLRLESPGGMVHAYGLAASQLKRIRDKGITLTICVDKVAASGGYMMACLGNRILAAPYAIIGSIGVVAQLPNFSKVLKKLDVDYELFTAGEYKRTVTMLGHNSPKAKEKFQDDLEETHELFKNHVKQQRPRVDIDAVANGDIWYGQQAIENKLIDEVSTSDEYLMSACENSDVYTVTYKEKQTFQERIGISIQRGVEKGFVRLLTLMQQKQNTKG